jgi:hypothetical protein
MVMTNKTNTLDFVSFNILKIDMQKNNSIVMQGLATC